MGAADGPRFAPPTKGAKSRVEADPCGCPECVAGPGINHLDENLGPVTRVIHHDFCPSCKKTVIVTAIRSGPGWQNFCPDKHTWTSFS